ncbi:hypothetical protein ACFW91_12790 [Streptomyces asoensis]|uniref:hypothetical protein n=1 Tax=Streptomyces asoensis TaxID=249586 RepID=UPI0036B096D4
MVVLVVLTAVAGLLLALAIYAGWAEGKAHRVAQSTDDLLIDRMEEVNEEIGQVAEGVRQQDDPIVAKVWQDSLQEFADYIGAVAQSRGFEMPVPGEVFGGEPAEETYRDESAEEAYGDEPAEEAYGDEPAEEHPRARLAAEQQLRRKTMRQQLAEMREESLRERGRGSRSPAFHIRGERGEGEAGGRE